MEFDRGDPAAAAAAYAKIATSATDTDLTARALLGQARCLAKAGQTAAAVKILTDSLSGEKYRDAVDAHDRRISLDAQFRALQLMADRAGPDHDRIARRLRDRLNDYADPSVPSPQRRFLMRELQTLMPDAPPFETLAAEELTAEYLAADPAPIAPARLAATPLPDTYQLTSTDRRVVAVFRRDRLLGVIRSLITSGVSLPGARVDIRPIDAARGDDASLLVGAAGRHMPDWELALHLDDPDPFAAAADRRIAGYLWTGVLVVLVIAILALLVARSIARQMRLTRLKNDLIATVSHELKTPLASMRVLADTLLAGKTRDERQAREYVELIAKENARLSRLIDNFLTFSRMERDKRSFESAEIDVAGLVAATVEAAGDRFAADDCTLEVEVAPDLPTVWGDRDALVTVLTNLLDNAYKYSDDPKHIVLRADSDASEAGGIRLSVTDNGIGLSRRAVKRVFNRFYQVDQSLSRRAGGCGLGLSIVKFIVDAHDGSIDVVSEPGRGSTFTVQLPAGSAVGHG